MAHATQTNNAQAKIAQPDNPSRTSGGRILVVEDARDIAALVQLHLCDEGHEVELAFDGVQGWEKLQARR